MIEAYFQTSLGQNIPALVPNGEVVEIAASLGIHEKELFSIDIPSGATREARITVLIAEANLDALYASDTGGDPSAIFYWRETTNATHQSMLLFLLPPRPLYVVAGGSGIAIVEAVDVRYWWKQTQNDEFNDVALASRLYSSDGRRLLASTPSPNTSVLQLVTAIRDFLISQTSLSAFTIPGAFSPTDPYMDRYADIVFTPECSLAMSLDIVLSSCGWMLQWDTTAQVLTLVEVGNDIATLNTYMTANKRAFRGGAQASSQGFGATDPLATIWEGTGNWQINSYPSAVTYSFPFRTCEGKTYYNNTLTTNLTGNLYFSTDKEYGWIEPLITDRFRASIGTRVLKEPRSLTASNSAIFFDAVYTNNLAPTSGVSVGVGWNYDGATAVANEALVKRTTVMHGKIMWAGWNQMPNGSYRSTMLRYSITLCKGEWIPICLTDSEKDDWILGTNGIQTDDPKQIVASKGMVHARRLNSGMLQMDVAPPNCRVFPARITGYEPFATWKNRYNFVEVEPKATLTPITPMITEIGNWARTSTTFEARNLIENSNVYIAAGDVGNFIAPGISQADYTNATIEALAIPINTIVMMVEQFLVSKENQTLDSTLPPRYWFVMPQAVRVTCIEPA
jgi:hypothetical protein